MSQRWLIGRLLFGVGLALAFVAVVLSLAR
jgi:hypothetical protein